MDDEDPRRHLLERAWQRIIGHDPDPNPVEGRQPAKVLAGTCRPKAHSGDAGLAPSVGAVWSIGERLLYVTPERTPWDDAEYGSTKASPGRIAPVPVILHRHWLPPTDERELQAFCPVHGALPVSHQSLLDICVQRGDPRLDRPPRAWIRSVESVLDLARLSI